jgi:hypothetical protein
MLLMDHSLACHALSYSRQKNQIGLVLPCIPAKTFAGAEQSTAGHFLPKLLS